LKYIPFIFILFGLCVACKDDDSSGGDMVPDCKDLTDIPFRTSPKNINLPEGYQPFYQPLDNEMTNEGVLLGRHLFFDPILSADSTMSCGTCHGLDGNFTDNKKLSRGIDGTLGKRSSMALVDLVYAENGLFWDGRVNTLEAQALLPIEDPTELHDTWENVEEKLRRSDRYPSMFRKAFGIKDDCDITRDLASKAIAQFERSLISLGNSRYDRIFIRGDGFATESELRGFQFFNDRDFGDNLADAECFHCHAPPTFTDNLYHNNGLTFFTDETALSIDDLGRYEVTGKHSDIGLFRTPSLRNIEFSAPYMHDGRFNTLEEVMDHYICGVQQSPTLNVLLENHCDPNDQMQFIDEQGKQDIIAFMLMLSDTTFFDNPDYQSPY
jgi:cytochrome c peroxidase